MKRSRVLIADDHWLLLDAMRLLIEPEFEVVETVDNGHDLLEAAKRLKPDIILLDIAMPVLNGIDAAYELHKSQPSARIIIVSMHADSDYVTEAFRAGASGYVLKRSAGAELLNAMREVSKGNYYVTPLVTRNALELLIRSTGPQGKFHRGALTPRRRQVLQLVAEGRNRKEIAGVLNVSVKTVEFHKAAISRELNLHTHSDYTRYAIEHGIISAERS